jgi:2-polyprenyl-3-methyl-5-hydroxy-6-metoxy-1,4-benzoquinol methylase
LITADLDITDDGERVTHLYPNSSYYAHLSIYHFALPYAQDRTILDAGSGAGYGAAYLAAHGARHVHALDVSEKAVAFSREHFRRDNLDYQTMDLGQVDGFAAQSIDLVFTSNVLEHITGVPAFLSGACRLLRRDGTMIVAVPPVYNDASRAANLANPYHLNIWSPRQWHYTLTRYFHTVSCIRHHFEKPGTSLNFADTPETCRLREDDFLFLPSSVDELSILGALTAIFVAQMPLPADALPAPDKAPPMVDDSFSRPAPTLKLRPLDASTGAGSLIARFKQRLRQVRLRLPS